MRPLWLTIALLLLAVPCALAPGSLAQPVPMPVPEPEPEAATVPTLRIPFWFSTPNLDPHRAGALDPVSLRAVSLVYDTLYMWMPGDEPRVAPALAADWPAASEDGLTVTIKLRADVKFHSHACFGESRTRNLTSGDVVRSIKRAAQFRETGMGWLMDTLVVGLDDFATRSASGPGRRKQPGTDAPVEGITAPDNETVVFKLTRPCASLPTMLAHPGFSILPIEAMENRVGALNERAVGTGPYRLNALAADRLVVFKRFDGYWGDAPRFPRVLFTRDDDASSYPVKLAQGIYAEAQLWPGLSYENAVKDGKPSGPLANSGSEIIEQTQHGYRWLAFNMSDPVWGALDDDGRKLRRAVALACDRRDLLAEPEAGRRWEEAQSALLPDGTLFSGSADQLDYGKFDRDEARKLLATSKFAGGKDPATGKPLVLDILATDNDEFNATVGMLRKGLNELGIRLTVRYVEARNYRRLAIKSDQQVFSAGWYLDYPDPANFFQVFRGINVARERELEFTNYARYDSGEFNRLFDEYETLPPTPENQQRLRELTAAMAAELAKDQPTIPLERSHGAYARSGKIEWPKCARQTFNDLRFCKEKAE